MDSYECAYIKKCICFDDEKAKDAHILADHPQGTEMQAARIILNGKRFSCCE